MKKSFKFYAIDRATGEETEIDANAIKLVCDDGQEFELATYLLSGEVKLEAKGTLQVRPDTMSSVVIEDKPCTELSTSLSDTCKKYRITQEVLKVKYDADLSDYVSEAEYTRIYRKLEPHAAVVHIAAKHDLLRVMPKLEYLFPGTERTLKALTIRK